MENIVTPFDALACNLKKLSDTAEHVARDVDAMMNYLISNTSPETDVLKQLRHETMIHPWETVYQNKETECQLTKEMISDPVEIKFLQFLVKMIKPKYVLEIGMFTGYSALAMAEALPNDGKIIACEHEKYAINFANRYFQKSPAGSKITIKSGPALKSLNDTELSDKKFEFVFIDANKLEYTDYLKRILNNNLLAENGFICVDNTLYKGEVYSLDASQSGNAIKSFNEFVTNNSRLEQVILSVRDGITLISLATE
jgi:caffeoyl-CoA O-methyltransferase